MTIKDLQTEMIASNEGKGEEQKRHNLRANCRR